MVPSKYKRKNTSKVHPKPFYLGATLIILGGILLWIDKAPFWVNTALIVLGFIIFLYGCRDINHVYNAEEFIIRVESSEGGKDDNRPS